MKHVQGHPTHPELHAVRKIALYTTHLVLYTTLNEHTFSGAELSHMTTAVLQEITPQEQLARIVREETNGGRSIVRFFRQVVECERDSEGFQPNHKMDSAKELVKIGLSEFQDYIDANAAPTKRRKSSKPSPDINEISPEILKAREELAQYARELTLDGRTVIEMYSEVMDGLRNDDGFKPHHRIAAGKELLLRGFGPISAWPEPVSTDCKITDHHQN